MIIYFSRVKKDANMDIWNGMENILIYIFCSSRNLIILLQKKIEAHVHVKSLFTSIQLLEMRPDQRAKIQSSHSHDHDHDNMTSFSSNHVRRQEKMGWAVMLFSSQVISDLSIFFSGGDFRMLQYYIKERCYHYHHLHIIISNLYWLGLWLDSVERWI